MSLSKPRCDTQGSADVEEGGVDAWVSRDVASKPLLFAFQSKGQGTATVDWEAEVVARRSARGWARGGEQSEGKKTAARLPLKIMKGARKPLINCLVAAKVGMLFPVIHVGECSPQCAH